MKLTKTHSDYENEINKKHNNEYVLLNKYNGCKSFIKVKHLKCGRIYEVRADQLLSGRKCAKCQGVLKKTHEEFLQEVKTLFNNKIIIKTKYKTTNEKVLVLNNNCGHEYKMTPNHLLNRKDGCPICRSIKIVKESKAIKELKILLKKLKIDFIQEYIPNKNPLISDDGQQQPFDLYLIDYNLIIEYDGRQHFKEGFSKSHSIRKKKFIQRKLSDQRKNNWAKENKEHALLRIPYTVNPKYFKTILVSIIDNQKRSETIEKHNLFYISKKSRIILNEENFMNLVE